MGFTTGFLGGMTLTYSVLYMTIYLHKANRNAQHTILSQSSSLLKSIVEPPEPVPDPPAYEVQRAGLTEQLKDRWNSELEKMVRKVQTTDWNEQREIYEQKIASAWSSLKQTEQAQQLEQKLNETKDSAISAAKQAKENVVDAAKQAKDRAVGDAKEAKQDLKDAKETAKDQTRQPRLLELR